MSSSTVVVLVSIILVDYFYIGNKVNRSVLYFSWDWFYWLLFGISIEAVWNGCISRKVRGTYTLWRPWKMANRATARGLALALKSLEFLHRFAIVQRHGCKRVMLSKLHLIVFMLYRNSYLGLGILNLLEKWYIILATASRQTIYFFFFFYFIT